MDERLVGMMAVAALVLLLVALVLTCVNIAIVFGVVAALSLAITFCVLGFLMFVSLIASIRATKRDHTQDA